MHEQLFERIARSKFRSKFRLSAAEQEYARARKRTGMTRHAREIITARLAQARPPKDGKQTPYRGHPVFVAQHATGTCCRSCLEKWHGIAKGVALTDVELDYVCDVIVAWIFKDVPDPE